jgi:hypothetical protein
MANISKFDHLSTVATRLILSYTKQNFSADRKEALIQLTSMLESLKDRTDWIDEDGLIELKELTNDINDHELNELVGYIFMKIKK